MAAPSHQSVKLPAGPVRDYDTVRVCNLAGITRAKEQLVTFSDLKRGIEMSLRELESQKKSDRVVSNVFMVLKFTKATCDAFIGMAAELSNLVPGAEKGARAVATSYGIAGVAAETTSTAALGGKVNYAQAAIDTAKAATGAITGGKNAATYEFVAKSTVIKAELVVNALNAQRKEVTKSATEYAYEFGKFTLDALDTKKASMFAGIAMETFRYHQRLQEIFEEFIGENESSTIRIAGLRASFMLQARSLQKRIDDLNAFIRSCE